MSMGSMPCALMVSMCSGTSRRARMPAMSLGCMVLTRPSSISGKPVTSSTSVTGMPESLSSLAVPPVEMICTPRSVRPLANDSRPLLLNTEMRARWTFTGTLLRTDDRGGPPAGAAAAPGPPATLQERRRPVKGACPGPGLRRGASAAAPARLRRSARPRPPAARARRRRGRSSPRRGRSRCRRPA